MRVCMNANTIYLQSSKQLKPPLSKRSASTAPNPRFHTHCMWRVGDKGEQGPRERESERARERASERAREKERDARESLGRGG